jgi:ApaG protein
MNQMNSNNIVSEITNNVKIVVESVFLPDKSDANIEQYVFGYRISIENYSEAPIQLIYRNWYIMESSGHKREVAGEGVIGLKPIIQPNDFHQYTSFCNLQTELGSMKGYYTMQNLTDDSLFKVRIPKFLLVASNRLN